MVEISTLGAIIGLLSVIVLIFRKVNPFYAMICGALIGGIIGGASFVETINIIIGGAQSIVPAVMRVLTAGVFAGVLIETGAADKIAETIINSLGENLALLAIILSACIVCAVGVIVPVSVITVAPVALLIGCKANISKPAILLAMLGGAKAGNIISPNPNTIAIADGFHVDLSLVMLNGFIPALFGLAVTFIIANSVAHKSAVTSMNNNNLCSKKTDLPSFFNSLVGPIVVILLLAINSFFNLKIDSMIILPFGGLAGAVAMGKAPNFFDYSTKGLNKMTGTAILLLGTGTIAGIISKSCLSASIIGLINFFGVSNTLVASISGILMGGATASITGGSVVTSTVFSTKILDMGIKAIPAAEMVHTGVSVLDDLPHGNLFHISAKSVELNIAERAKLIPYELVIGLAMNVVATVFFGFFMS